MTKNTEQGDEMKSVSINKHSWGQKETTTTKQTNKQKLLEHNSTGY